MSKEQGKLTGLESFFYYFSVILSFGFYWILKIVIKKAIIESKDK
jgi:hypothetical protein